MALRSYNRGSHLNSYMPSSGAASLNSQLYVFSIAPETRCPLPKDCGHVKDISARKIPLNVTPQQHSQHLPHWAPSIDFAVQDACHAALYSLQ